MGMVKDLANSPTCAFGNFPRSLGRANADILAGNDCTLSYIASGINRVKGNKISRAFPDSLGCGTCPLRGPFANVSRTAANVMAGVMLLLGLRLGLRIRLRYIGRLRRRLGMAVLARSAVAVYCECQGEKRDCWNRKCGSHV